MPSSFRTATRDWICGNGEIQKSERISASAASAVCRRRGSSASAPGFVDAWFSRPKYRARCSTICCAELYGFRRSIACAYFFESVCVMERRAFLFVAKSQLRKDHQQACPGVCKQFSITGGHRAFKQIEGLLELFPLRGRNLTDNALAVQGEPLVFHAVRG